MPPNDDDDVEVSQTLDLNESVRSLGFCGSQIRGEVNDEDNDDWMEKSLHQCCEIGKEKELCWKNYWEVEQEKLKE